MPLLGSKKRKMDAPISTSPPTATVDTTGPEVDENAGSSKRKPSLAPRSSSAQLRTASPASGTSQPGLKRGKSPSWYGSFNNKAAAIAQVAKESISVTGGSTSDSTSAQSKSGPYIHNSLRSSHKSIPASAEASKVNATGSKTELPTAGDSTKDVKEPGKETEKGTGQAVNKKMDEEDDQVARDAEAPQSKQTPPSSSWFGWWSRPDGYAASEGEKAKDIANEHSVNEDRIDESSVKTPDTPLAESASAREGKESDAATRPPEASSRAWFSLWSTSQNQNDKEGDEDATANATQHDDASKSGADGFPAPPATQTETASKSDVTRPPLDRPKSSGWAFWSKSSHPVDGDGPQKHLGELAVADTPSQSHPEAAQFNQTPTKKSKQKTTSSGVSSKSIKNDTVTPASDEPTTTETAGKVDKKTVQTDNAFATSAKGAANGSLPVPEQPKGPEVKSSLALKALKAQQTPPNIIEPRFRNTYPQAHVPSYWETLGYYISLPFGVTPTGASSSPHVSISTQKPKIRSAIAIGVHGYFPAPILQKIIGQPTGTSIRFATHAAAAIRSWVEENQPDVPCEVEQVALEGEGFIADRVSILWKLLLNWLTHLRNADLILVAAHSQGVPVAVMLVAKLIQLGCLNPNAKVGICAMAGVNLGPFADYKSRFFGGSAAELFDFSNSQSRVSMDYASSLEIVLRHGVKVTYVGSMDDQLVSLESSLFANLTHPHIQRAVFIDGRLHAQDFVAHLVAFALKLRNLGISDHGLVRELSAPLAGSIYGGEGHSRIYDDDAVYEQALEFALETTDMDAKAYHKLTSLVSPASPASPNRRNSSERGVPPSPKVANSIRRRGSISASVQPGIAPVFTKYELPPSGTNANPYFLPWALRGILEEPAVKRDMQDEVAELIRLFDEWKPTSKVLKDVRFRLEAVKSKL